MTDATVTEYKLALSYANFPLLLWQEDLSFFNGKLFMCCAWILLRINWEQLCNLPRGLRGKKKSRSPHFSSKSKVTEACQSTGVLSDQGAVQRKAGKALIMGHLRAGKWLGMRAGPRPSQGTDGKSGPLYITRWTFSPVLPSHPLGLGKMQPCSNDGIS